VPPGDYLVMASIRETWMTDGEAPQVFSYAPTYFAGTGSPGDGQRVKVGVGQEVGGIDFGLLPIRAASLSGTAVGADGVPLAGATVSLNHEMAGPTFMTVGFAGTAKAAADGTWRMNDVAPGDYALEIRNTGREQGTETAYQPITVAGTDIENITLVAGAGGTAAGLVVTDSGAPLPEARLRVSATSTVPGSRMRPPFQEDNGLVGADGAFTLKGLIGPSLLRVGPLPRGWAIKEIEYGGRDHAETPLEVRSGQATSGVRIVLTKGFPAVTGHITDARGNPAEGTVLLFPADAARWLEAAGASRVARPDQAGLFRFDTVRPGDYLAVALEYVQQWQVFDPEFLEDLRDDATKVAVAEGADRQVNLRLKR
jgi:protocatechuate 3,4-dioxygenase beta subunit